MQVTSCELQLSVTKLTLHVHFQNGAPKASFLNHTKIVAQKEISRYKST